jgi:glycine/D-amino acid oxidase-like deaminating enzyme
LTRRVVLGAGVVGLTTALALQRSGASVTLIDRLAPGSGTSSGNAGIIATSSVHPEAMPGLLSSLPSMLLKPDGAVRLRPSFLLRRLPWLLRFLAQARPARAEAASVATSALSKPALRFWDGLLQEVGLPSPFVRRGLLYAYGTPQGFAAALRDNAYRERRTIPFEILSGAEARALEPDLAPSLAGAIYAPEAAHHPWPQTLSDQLFERFLARGGRFHRTSVRAVARSVKGASVQLEGQTLAADQLFICAGAYSATFTGQLGWPVPLVTERGYHILHPEPGIALQRTVLFPELGFAATPMAEGLRLAGTVELASLEAAPDWRRAQGLSRQAARMLPQLQGPGVKPWLGFRPSLPDSLPVLGAAPDAPGQLFFAFGHGHLGLTQAAVSATSLAALAEGERPPLDLHPYRVNRPFPLF